MRTAVRNCVACLVGAVLASAFVSGSKTSSAEQYMQEAKAFHARHEGRAAVIQLKNVLSIEPNRAEARFLLGKVYNEIGDYFSAEIELRQVQRTDSDPAKNMLELARSLLGQHKYAKVLDEIASFQDEHPDLTPALLTIEGSARLGMGRQDGKSSYMAALQKDPAFVDAQLGLARVAAHEGRFEDVLRQIDLMLAQAPENIAVWLFKGDLARGSSMPEEAEKSYRRAAEINPNIAEARLRLADLYVDSDKLESARAEIDKVRKIDPENIGANFEQAAIYMRQNKYEEARDSIQQVRRWAPYHLPSMYLSGAASYFLGLTEQADKDLRTYLSRFPNNVSARKLLVANSLRANEPGKALESVTPLLSTGTDSQAFAVAGEAALRARLK